MVTGPLSQGTSRRRQFTTAFVASIVSIVVTLLGIVLTQASASRNGRYAVPALYVFIVAGLLLLGLLHLRAYIGDLFEIRRGLRDYEIFRRSVPTLVTFRNREDTLTVEPSGDGLLAWSFELVANSLEHIVELTFPIYVEVPADDPPPQPITVEQIEVNGRRRSITDVYKPIEKRHPLDRPTDERVVIEYGLLRVPVELEAGRRFCRVRVTMRLAKAYLHQFRLDPLFIEIPYVTEKLCVRVRSRGLSVRPRPEEAGGPTVMAMSSQMHTFDPTDSTKQSNLCKEHGGELLWETDSPKLGYQYKVFFRVEQG